MPHHRQCHSYISEYDMDHEISHDTHSIDLTYTKEPNVRRLKRFLKRLPPTVKYFHLTVPSDTIIDDLLVVVFKRDKLDFLEVNGGEIQQPLPKTNIGSVEINYHTTTLLSLPNKIDNITTRKITNCSCVIQ